MFDYLGIEDAKSRLIEACLFSQGFLTVGDVVSIFNITDKDDISKLYSFALDKEIFMDDCRKQFKELLTNYKKKEQDDGSTRTN